MRRLILVTLILAAILAVNGDSRSGRDRDLSVVSATRSSGHDGQRDVDGDTVRLLRAVRVAPKNITADPMDDVIALAAFLDQVAADATLTGVAAYWQTLAEYVASVTPIPAAAPAARTTGNPSGASGGSTAGGHSDAWWQGVAQCEQGGRNDPYFGYFSWMDGSQGGRSWDEQVAASNDLLARAGREVGPWAAACVAAGYRAAAW